VNLETAAFLAGNLAEAAVVGLLIYRRAWRTLPFFCVYSLDCLIGSILFYFVESHFSAVTTFNTYFYESILDFALQFCVLVEVAWSILRPFQKSLPRYTVLVLGVLIAGAGLAIWPFVNPVSPVHTVMITEWRLTVRLQETVSIIRVLFFLILAGCSQLLSIGWRDRELQVATGLGFYSFVSLSVTLWHSHQTSSFQYTALESVLAATAAPCVLLYWIFSFAQKEAERRQFSPQMQSVLLAIAGTARSTRIALSDSAPVSLGKDGRQ
jgi:hypothetical protein